MQSTNLARPSSACECCDMELPGKGIEPHSRARCRERYELQLIHKETSSQHTRSSCRGKVNRCDASAVGRCRCLGSRRCAAE